ncbi:hypothetical protein [Bradyrhizobium paxllaeri]|uniref:hypothetical protein n=1 Tax=Bradyrhizobium paxllaeri TaxID=190148 RepID=UPI00081045EA|nr:hypothetical protein [Bradyrhizobium paxllaeri]
MNEVVLTYQTVEELGRVRKGRLMVAIVYEELADRLPVMPIIADPRPRAGSFSSSRYHQNSEQAASSREP